MTVGFWSGLGMLVELKWSGNVGLVSVIGSSSSGHTGSGVGCWGGGVRMDVR